MRKDRSDDRRTFSGGSLWEMWTAIASRQTLDYTAGIILGEDDIRTPCAGAEYGSPQKEANRAPRPGERANAPLKSWPIFGKLRSCR
jgi:hypothetical protein